MTTGGWINMVLSVGFVTVLFVYCIVRVLRGPEANQDPGLARIEPLDKSEVNER